MLYNLNWNKKDKPEKSDPFMLDTLISWLEKQPSDGSYNYPNSQKCLLAQYFTAQGFNLLAIGVAGLIGYAPEAKKRTFFSRRNPTQDFLLPPGFNSIAFFGEHSYGGALKRAKSFREKGFIQQQNPIAEYTFERALSPPDRQEVSSREECSA